MATVENFIETKYRDLGFRISIEYIDLYGGFSNRKLQEIFSTIHSMLIENFRAMNSRLPTNEHTAHYWADKSRELILAIDVINGLERVLAKTNDAFSIDSYYKEIINKSEKFLESSGGSVIPQGMDKIELYYTEPIFIKKDLVNICTSPIEQKYVGLEQIGHGSYATVYSYTDPFYNRKYVLKRAKNNLSGKELERFRQEYYQMAQLSSPYIVEVYHYNETKYEYVMEYMDCTLGDYILNTSPKPNKIERIKIVNQVLRAFQYIHTKGLLHRDISPSNILIKKYDDVNIIKIADFGLVKVPNSTLTSLYSTVKGAFNDPALDSEGYANYSIEDETFALTKIVLFIMTGSAMMRSDTDESLKSFFQKGVSSDKTNRYHSVDEMIIAFKNLK